MNLHLSTEFEGLIRDTAQSIDLPEFHVRKDYWVTLSLKALSESPHAGHPGRSSACSTI